MKQFDKHFFPMLTYFLLFFFTLTLFYHINSIKSKRHQLQATKCFGFMFNCLTIVFISHFLSFPGVLSLQEGQYWVPRIRLQFCAEDPRVFAQRIQFAQNLRQKTEALLLYHLSIDCMPVWSGTPTLDPTSLKRIRKYALSTPGLHLER